MHRFTVISLLAFLLLGACSPSAPDCSRADVFCAGLVTDFGSVKSGIAHEAWLALEDARAAGIVDRIDAIETVDADDRAANIRAFAQAGYDVIVTVGAGISQRTTSAALEYPKLSFIGVEQPQDKKLPNLAGLIFQEDQSGFMAGALAALMTQTGHVAAVCESKSIQPIRRYCDGFEGGRATPGRMSA